MKPLGPVLLAALLVSFHAQASAQSLHPRRGPAHGTPVRPEEAQSVSFSGYQSFQKVSSPAIAWADDDADGDLDLLLAGFVASHTLTDPLVKIYRGTSSAGLAPQSFQFQGVTDGDVAWGDYDHDGDLDFIVSGSDFVADYTHLYRNDGGAFSLIPTNLPAFYWGSLDWGDFDGDLDLDLLISGGQQSETDPMARVYRNEGNGMFLDMEAGLAPAVKGAVAWGDYNNDGDLDILLTGELAPYGSDVMISKVYLNEGDGTFTDIGAGLEGVGYSVADWADFDGDGLLDILLAGYLSDGGLTARVYRNDGSGFMDIGAGLEGTGNGGGGWGDYDHDGDPDILLTGEVFPSSKHTWIYRNDGGVFVDILASIPGVTYGDAAWGDLDGDDDLDVFITGEGANSVQASLVYRNDGNVFVLRTNLSTAYSLGKADLADYDGDGKDDLLLSASGPPYIVNELTTKLYRNNAGVFEVDPWFTQPNVPGMAAGSLAWADYDNDGDVDVLMIGAAQTPEGLIGRIYRKKPGGGFENSGATLPLLDSGDAEWGDCDNDGDLDLLVVGGNSDAQPVSAIYRNDGGGVFADIGAGLVPVTFGSVAWGDYDNDDDLDLILTGETNPNGVDAPTTRIYRNEGNEVFVDVSAGFDGTSYSTVDWGDYDNDGDLDLLLSGYEINGGYITSVYRNEGGTFVDIGAGLVGTGNGGGGWGDYDNDGDLDILLTGEASPSDTWIYRNEGGVSFVDVGVALPGIWEGDAIWGDFDHDSDLDVALIGPGVSGAFESSGAPPNSVPSAPTNLTGTVMPDDVMLSWNPSTDAETPSMGLSYNIRVGTTPGGSEIVSAMADPSNGHHFVVGKGNAQLGTSWRLKLAPGTYYWSVQAVDHTFEGGPFAPETRLDVIRFSAASGAGLPALTSSALAAADYDGDGHLDLGIAGTNESSMIVTRLYHNDGDGTFSDAGAGLVGVETGVLAWADYDRDGDPDLLVSGGTALGVTTTLYQNNGGAFAAVAAGLPDLYWSAAAWGDCDNDGDPDLLLAGGLPASPNDEIITRLYRNEGDGTFADLAAGLPGVVLGALAWGDYDGDDDLDLLITGETDPFGTDTPITRVFRNDEGAFNDVSAALEGVSHSVAEWGDFDDDGDLDILLSGYALTGPGLGAFVYRNDAGTFVDIDAGLEEIGNGGGAWGDYDNDGDLDILLCGEGGPTGTTTRLYRNEAGSSFIEMVDLDVAFPGIAYGDALWGDFDGDADLDVVLTGEPNGPPYLTSLYLSDGTSPNAAPGAPVTLLDQASPTTLTMNWGGATDAETDADGLSYNVRVGTSSGAGDVVSPLSDGATGQRRIVATGNAQTGPAWRLNLEPGTYYWSVQSIDHGFAGSAFSAERAVTIVKLEDGGAGLTGSVLSAAAWADYDLDGDLDLVLTGSTTPEPTLTPWTRVYRNEGATQFTELDLGLTDVAGGAVAWGDHDHDGRPDVLLSGQTDTGPVTDLFRNPGATFVKEPFVLTPVWRSAAAWADFDHDGHEDLVLTGLTAAGTRMIELYHNDGTLFAPVGGAWLEAVSSGAVAWADVDNDHDLDLMVAGESDGGPSARLYENTAGAFTEVATGIAGVQNCAMAWGSLDSDKDPDLVLAGNDGTGRVTRVYRNNLTSGFELVATVLPGVENGSIALGDFDNDGDLDILLAGLGDGGRICDVYRNVGGMTFEAMNLGLPGVSEGAVAWQDADGDGDLDAFIAGESDTGPIAAVYLTAGPEPDGGPMAPPGGLIAHEVRNPGGGRAGAAGAEAATGVGLVEVAFAWGAGSDAETPAEGLTYNLRVGTRPGDEDVMASLSDLATGARRVAAPGNVRQALGWSLMLPEGVYYWSVQTVDGAFAGSPFTAEQMIATSTAVGPSAPERVSFDVAGSNPGAGPVRFGIGLPARAHVQLTIHDLAGRRLATLLDSGQGPGYAAAQWSPRTTGVGPGVYFARCRVGGRELMRKIIVLE